ncbi:MAG: GDP-mannose 4,6-dehydratase [Candidatus Nanoarchaeia archaeon]|nr:GDP-mannose 4,6-dehydratase [Candidatus Nanoarchaeia archaeon]
MKYLVTGGAGFIGGHLVDRLLESGNRVVVIDNFFGGREENIEHHEGDPNFVLHRRSVCDDLTDIFEKESFDGVFHLAAVPRVQYSIQKPYETHETNVNGHLNLLMFCKKFGIKRFIFSSSSSVYGNSDDFPSVETMKPNPISPYALHKFIGEEYNKLFNILYGFETINLRYFNVYGPRQDPKGPYALLITRFMDMIAKGERPIINGDGEQTRDFTYVTDVVEANILAMRCSNKACFGQVFNIGNGRNISVNKVTEEIIKLSGKPIEPIHGPSVIEPKNTLADYRKAKEMLGWKPKIEFEEGLKMTYEDYIKHSHPWVPKPL